MLGQWVQKQWIVLTFGVLTLIGTGYFCFALQPETTSWQYLSSVLYQGQRLRWDFSTHAPLTACISVPENPTDIGTRVNPLVVNALQQWLAVLPESQKTSLQMVVM